MIDSPRLPKNFSCKILLDHLARECILRARSIKPFCKVYIFLQVSCEKHIVTNLQGKNSSTEKILQEINFFGLKANIIMSLRLLMKR